MHSMLLNKQSVVLDSKSHEGLQFSTLSALLNHSQCKLCLVKHLQLVLWHFKPHIQQKFY